MNNVRIDKWLWAARFFKTRNKATLAVNGGKVHLNGARIKASREVKIGDRLTVSRRTAEEEFVVTGVTDRRGSATVAQGLYQETDESIERRNAAITARRMQKAGLSIPNRRPTKAERRKLLALKQSGY